MNNVTKTIEDELIAFAGSLYVMNQEVIDLYQYYWGTSANSLIDALAQATTPATTVASGSLNKGAFLNGITLVDTVNKFLNNQVVGTGGHLALADTLRNGSSPAEAALSNDVEDIGKRLKALALDLIQLNKNAANIEKTYNSSYLSAVIGGLPASNVVFGCNLTQARLLSGIVLLQQFQKMMTNQAVTQADYLSTVQNLAKGA